jgi:hypothetical protein
MFSGLTIVFSYSDLRPSPFSQDVWVSVLRASTRLGLQAVREFSIDELDRFQIEPTKQILLAQDLDVQSWIKPACEELSRRSTSLSLEEARMVGLDTAVEVFHLREQNRTCISCLQQLPFKVAEYDTRIQAPTTMIDQYPVTGQCERACQGLEVANDEALTAIVSSAVNERSQCYGESLNAKAIDVLDRGHEKENQQIRILSRGHARPGVTLPISPSRTAAASFSPASASALAEAKRRNEEAAAAEAQRLADEAAAEVRLKEEEAAETRHKAEAEATAAAGRKRIRKEQKAAERQEAAEAERKCKEDDAAERKRIAEEKKKKKKAEDERRRKAEEAAAEKQRKADEAAAAAATEKQKEEEKDAAKKKRKEEEEAAAEKKCQEDETAAEKKREEAGERKKTVAELRKLNAKQKKAVEAERKRKAEEAEAERKHKAEEEEVKPKSEEEEIATVAKAEADRLAKEAEEKQKAEEEAAKKAAEVAEGAAKKAEEERLAKEAEEKKHADEEATPLVEEEVKREANEEAAALATKEAEREKKAEEEAAAKQAAEEAEAAAKKAEDERLAKEEEDRKAAEAAKQAEEEAQRAKEEADRLAKEEADRLAKEEADHLAEEEADRLTKEGAERLAKAAEDAATKKNTTLATHKAAEDALADASASTKKCKEAIKAWEAEKNASERARPGTANAVKEADVRRSLVEESADEGDRILKRRVRVAAEAAKRAEEDVQLVKEEVNRLSKEDVSHLNKAEALKNEGKPLAQQSAELSSLMRHLYNLDAESIALYEAFNSMDSAHTELVSTACLLGTIESAKSNTATTSTSDKHVDTHELECFREDWNTEIRRRTAPQHLAQALSVSTRTVNASGSLSPSRMLATSAISATIEVCAYSPTEFPPTEITRTGPTLAGLTGTETVPENSSATVPTPGITQVEVAAANDSDTAQDLSIHAKRKSNVATVQEVSDVTQAAAAKKNAAVVALMAAETTLAETTLAEASELLKRAEEARKAWDAEKNVVKRATLGVAKRKAAKAVKMAAPKVKEAEAVLKLVQARLNEGSVGKSNTGHVITTNIKVGSKQVAKEIEDEAEESMLTFKDKLEVVEMAMKKAKEEKSAKQAEEEKRWEEMAARLAEFAATRKKAEQEQLQVATKQRHH